MRLSFSIFLIFIVQFVNAQKTFSPYTSSSDWNAPIRWKNPKDKLNKEGLITRNNQLNAVTIFQYALVHYDLFVKTKDSSYYKTFITQVEKYALDSSKYILIDEDKVGYPYKFNYKGLKAPWYSGMAQGYAISVLLRYYELTHNQKALDVAVKAKNLMLEPMPKGVFKILNDGSYWIEEYPSKQTPQVLNGYFISYIGLYEYCDYFPNDTSASRILKECYKSLKKKNLQYDTGRWLKYNASGGACTPGYMKFQVVEMKHLYELTQDKFFNNQMLIWASYTFGKDLKKGFDGGNIYYKEQMAYKSQMDKQKFTGNITLKNLITKNIDSLIINGKNNLKSKLIDGKDTSKLYLKSKKNTIELYLKDSIEFNNLKIANQNSFKTKLYYFSNEKNKWLKHKNYQDKSDSFNKKYSFNLDKTDRIKLQVKTKKNTSSYLGELSMTNTSKIDSKIKVLYKYSNPVKIDSSIKVNNIVELKNCKDFKIFYQYAEDKNDLGKQKWNANKYLKEGEIKLKKGYYNFLYVARISDENPYFKLNKFFFNK